MENIKFKLQFSILVFPINPVPWYRTIFFSSQNIHPYLSVMEQKLVTLFTNMKEEEKQSSAKFSDSQHLFVHATELYWITLSIPGWLWTLLWAAVICLIILSDGFSSLPLSCGHFTVVDLCDHMTNDEATRKVSLNSLEAWTIKQVFLENADHHYNNYNNHHCNNSASSKHLAHWHVPPGAKCHKCPHLCGKIDSVFTWTRSETFQYEREELTHHTKCTRQKRVCLFWFTLALGQSAKHKINFTITLWTCVPI